MMKVYSGIMILLLASCGANSSPEKRVNNKIEQLQNQIDTLKKQNTAILDSLSKINALINRSSN